MKITNIKSFEQLLSFLQGASLALALAGSGYAFLLFSPFGFFIAFFLALFFFLVGACFLVLFVVAQLQIEKLKELKKQTKLLEMGSSDDQALSHNRS